MRRCAVGDDILKGEIDAQTRKNFAASANGRSASKSQHGDISSTSYTLTRRWPTARPLASENNRVTDICITQPHYTADWSNS